MTKDGLAGRAALVTGASRRQGIGAAVCRALAAKGADVFFTHWRAYDRAMPWGADEDGPSALAAEVRGLGVQCEGVEADLADPTTAPRVLDAAQAALGRAPVILVNNAAHPTLGGWETLDAAALDAHYAVNVRGALLLCAEFARRCPPSSPGRIINLTSGQSLHPMPDELAYAATKGAVEAFTLSLSAGLAGRGITVNAVDPGATDTGWMNDSLKTALTSHSPHDRVGRPEDAARLIAFLAGDDAPWITGQIIRSRGGL